jgi:hypothetical protein
MGNNCVFKNDIGTEIILDTENNISTGSIFRIYYKKPDNTVDFWVGSLFETTKIKYTTLIDDLDTVGDWLLQAYVVLPAWSGYGCKVTLNVKRHI